MKSVLARWSVVLKTLTKQKTKDRENDRKKTPRERGS